MTFSHLGRNITLHADAPPSLSPASAHQLKRLAQTQSISALYHISALPIDTPSSTCTAKLPVPEPLPPQIVSILERFPAIFAEPSTLPPSRNIQHHIHLLPHTVPINVRPYRYPHFQKSEIERQISAMLTTGIIQPSHSPFSSPILLVKKKDGTWRCCVDYRALNAVTVKDRFPMPTIDELLDDLGRASWFSKLDLRQGFHQIRMAEEDAHKTAFRTHQGQYEFLVMPFGLCNAPSTFQAAMNDALQPFLRRFVAVFFDDILVYSPDLSSHVSHLEAVLSALADREFLLKQSKCSFAQRELNYLGHIISSQGVAPDPDKIAAMLEWPLPTCSTSLRGFLGLTGFYRKFVKGYAAIAAPLNSLLRKDKFAWSPDAHQAFRQLQQAMTETPVLANPNFLIPFTLETDASGTAMGAVLLQEGHPIAYYSKALCPRLQRASAYVRELHAITSAVRKWRHYLLGNSFIILTNHKSLKDLMSQTIQTPEQQTYLCKLLGFDYTIKYKPGAANVVADALSRISPAEATCLTLTAPHFLFLQNLRQALLLDPQYVALLQDIRDHPTNHPDITTHQDLLFRHGRVWIPFATPFTRVLLEEFHSSPLGGHTGVTKTLHRLRQNFDWPHLKDDVRRYVAQCATCQQTKYDTKKSAGLLQPLPIPSQVWEDLSLDFVTGLPLSQGYTVILVVVDRFSKAAHFGALPTHHTAYKVAVLFLDMVCRHHGFPRSLVSDRDPIFISNFWRELFRLSGTKLRMSTAYHPQTDGQTEVLNRTLEQYLRAYVHDQPSRWYRFLSLAEWSYNTTLHSSTGMTPFEVVYGKPPPTVAHYLQGHSSNDAVDSLLTTRVQLHAQLTRRLQRAQELMKTTADRHRRDLSFEVGDWVYVRLRPYRQTSIAPKYSKLAKRFYGPFQISARIGPVAYKLALPASSRIHPVFHVSLLKLHQGPSPASPGTLPELSTDNHPIVNPFAILDWKLDSSVTPPVKRVLVQWDDLPPEETSWESWDELKVLHNLADKVVFDEGGVDSNTATADQHQHIDTSRPKRECKKPAYLRDFV